MTNNTTDLSKEALNKILEHIPDPRQEAPSKLIIKDIVHGPEIGESLKEQAHNLIRRHTRASLLLAARQLKLKIENTIENVPLAVTIIHKVKSHLPEECRVCKEIYIVPVQEPSHRRNTYCHACGQGSHDCSQEVDVFRAIENINNDYLESAHLRWLCSRCDVSLHWQNNNLQNKFKIFYTGDKTYAEAVKTTNDIIISQSSNNSSSNAGNTFLGFETFFIPNDDGNNAAVPPSSPPNSASTPNQQIVNNQQVPNNIAPINNATQPNLKDVKKFPNMNKNKICTFLTKGRCRYGAKGENHLGKCDKYHPNQCKAYNLNGQTENGCKKGLKCSEWHATYLCRSSANSKTCTRPECPFKHHKDCTISRRENFFNNANNNFTHRQYQGPNFPIFNHRQPQQQNQRYNSHFSNQWRQPYQQTLNQPPQIPQEQLVHMIRTILWEENNHQYNTQM